MKLMTIRTGLIGKRSRRRKHFGSIRWVREIVIGPGRRPAVRTRRILHGDLKADPAAVENTAGQNARWLLVGSLEDLHHQNGPLGKPAICREIIVCGLVDR